MKSMIGIVALAVIAVAAVVGYTSFYTVSEIEQVIITQFGRPVGDPVTDAGLHFKTPFIQDVNVIEKRVMAWDGSSIEMPTRDKTYIVVNTFARWRISDPKLYFLRLSDERSARSRLDDVLGGETRSAVANNDLIEIVRSTQEREPVVDEMLGDAPGDIGVLQSISKGRSRIEEGIFKEAAPKLDEYGIELLDVRFKRINYNERVRQSIYDRMISERQQIAERFRSEGAGEAAKIAGRRERDLQRIESEAYRTVLEIRGRADAQATEIYAGAYNQSPEAVSFYEFIKSLEAFETMLEKDTTLVLTTDSDLFKYLKSID